MNYCTLLPLKGPQSKSNKHVDDVDFSIDVNSAVFASSARTQTQLKSTF